MKWMGACCVLGGCGSAWYLQKQRRMQERRVRQEIIVVLDRMAEEIEQRQTLLPRLAEETAVSCKTVVSACLRQFNRLLREGIPTAKAWKAAFSELPLPEEEKTQILLLGNYISKDTSTSVKQICFIEKRLKNLQKEEQMQRAETEKRTAVWWMSAAMMLLILLT